MSRRRSHQALTAVFVVAVASWMGAQAEASDLIAKVIAADATEISDLQVTQNEAGRLLVAWIERRPVSANPGQRISTIKTRLRDENGVWAPLQEVSPPVYQPISGLHLGVNAAGSQFVVWTQPFAGRKTVFAARGTGEANWAVNQLSDPEYDAPSVALDVGEDGGRVVWVEDRELGSTLVAAALNQDENWTAEHDLTTEAQIRAVELRRAGSHQGLVWKAQNEFNEETINYADYLPDGLINAPRIVSSTEDDLRVKKPDLAIHPSGKAIVTWLSYKHRPNAPKRVSATVRSQFREWSAPTRLSASTQSQTTPYVDIDADARGVITYRDGEPPSAQAHYVTQSSAGGWTVPRNISGSANDVRSLCLVHGATPFAIWVSSLGSQDSIEIADLWSTEPAISQLANESGTQATLVRATDQRANLVTFAWAVRQGDQSKILIQDRAVPNRPPPSSPPTPTAASPPRTRGKKTPPRVAAIATARWLVRGRRTTLFSMSLRQVTSGAEVSISCKGRGCSFRTTPYMKYRLRANLLASAVPRSRRRSLRTWHTLRTGARITIRVKKAGFMTKVITFRIRTRRQPIQRSVWESVG